MSLYKDNSTPSNHEDEPIIDKVDISSTHKDSPPTRQDEVTLSLDKYNSTPSNHEDEPIIDKVDISSTQKDSPPTRQDEVTLSLDKDNSTPRNYEDEPINTDSPKLQIHEDKTITDSLDTENTVRQCNNEDETITETSHITKRITTNTDDCIQPAVENNSGKRKFHDPIITFQKKERT